jgi:two-component system cell cycle response regulator
MHDDGPSNDALTGVFSLTQIRHLMRVEFSRAQRYGYPVSCVALACDRIDKLRDLYGYEFRETVLDAVIELLRKETRTCDYLGRLMNHRLLGILPHTTRAGAEATARRIIDAAHELAFNPEGTRIMVSLSIGVSHYEDENTMFFDSLVESAEGALEEALSAGGDRCIHRQPGPGGN